MPNINLHVKANHTDLKEKRMHEVSRKRPMTYQIPKINQIFIKSLLVIYFIIHVQLPELSLHHTWSLQTFRWDTSSLLVKNFCKLLPGYRKQLLRKINELGTLRITPTTWVNLFKLILLWRSKVFIKISKTNSSLCKQRWIVRKMGGKKFKFWMQHCWGNREG